MSRIDELIEAVTDELAVDTSSLLDDTVCARQLRIDRLADLAAALAAANLADIDRRGVEPAPGQSTPRWLALEDRIGPGLAQRRVRTARRLGDRLAATHQAWVQGRINAEHVRVLSDAAANLRVGERVCDAQEDLIRLAGELTFAHWRQMVVYLVRELDEDGAFDPDAELERNRATLSETIDGNCVLDARFDRVRYHRIKHHIDTKTQELFRHYAQRATIANGELPIPSPACLRALAIYELIEAGAAAEHDAVTPTQATVVLTPAHLPDDHPLHECPPVCVAEHHGTDGAAGRRSTARRAHEADLADAAVAGTTKSATGDVARGTEAVAQDRADGEPAGHVAAGEPGRSSEATRRLAEAGDRPDVSQPARERVGDADESHRRHGAGLIGGWRAWSLDGIPLPACSPDLMAMLCDANLEVLIADADARPLALGRTQRLFSRQQRRTMTIRDGGRAWPGCTRPASQCRFHHVEHYVRDHGPTDTANGAPLCDRDHGIPHRDGWDMFLSVDEWPWFRTPDGHTFWGQRHGHQRQGHTPDHPDYIPPPTPRRPKRQPNQPPPSAPAAAPCDRQPADPAPVWSIPPERRRTPEDIARCTAVLADLRARLRREIEAEPYD